MEEEVPDEPYAIPFGEANVTREGDDVTIVAFGRMVNFANEAADKLSKEGITCTVVDPRTTSPLDTETILETVEETGRLVVVDEAHPRCSMATDISALVAAERVRGAQGADPQLVTAPHAPVPFSPALEDLYIPSAGQDRGRAVASGGRWREAACGLMSDEIQPIVMPKWGLAMQEGMLATWLVDGGRADRRRARRSSTSRPRRSPTSSRARSPAPLRRRLVGEGETVPVGALLGVVADASVAGRARSTPSSPSSRRSFAAAAAEAAASAARAARSSRPAAGASAI